MALAQVVSVPAAHLAHTEGTVAYAPQGDNEWHDVQPLRVLKRGDRLWTDRGSRAEVQAGGHALRLDGQTQLVLENVSETATQLSLTQGTIAATVTRVNPGDSFEIGTPNLAFRARQPGDYRIDADPKQGVTRIVVLSGAGVVYGEKGEALEVRSGQRVAFRGRDLTRVPQAPFAAPDDFDRWAAARRRGEPTGSMPALAAAPAAPAFPKNTTVSTGPDIVIPGTGPAPAGIKGNGKVAATSARALAPVANAPTRVVASTPGPLPVARAAGATALKVAVPASPAVAAAPAAGPVQTAAAPQAAATPAPRAPVQPQVQAQARATAAPAVQQPVRQRVAQRTDDHRHAATARAEQDKRAALEARRAEERRHAAVAARHAEDDRRHALAKREQERRVAARRADEERRHAIARRAAEEKERKLAAARKSAEDAKLAEARRRQIARLQEQAAREEQAAQARRDQLARRAEEERRDQQARREEADRRQRALAEQVRRDQQRQDDEVWLRQQQLNQPMRPVPMGVPFVRRVS